MTGYRIPSTPEAREAVRQIRVDEHRRVAMQFREIAEDMLTPPHNMLMAFIERHPNFISARNRVIISDTLMAVAQEIETEVKEVEDRAQRNREREANGQTAAARARLARLEATEGLIPALPGEKRISDDDGHLGHLSHDHESGPKCSCGEMLGSFTWVPPEPGEALPRCEICTARGLHDEEPPEPQ